MLNKHYQLSKKDMSMRNLTLWYVTSGLKQSCLRWLLFFICETWNMGINIYKLNFASKWGVPTMTENKILMNFAHYIQNKYNICTMWNITSSVEFSGLSSGFQPICSAVLPVHHKGCIPEIKQTMDFRRVWLLSYLRCIKNIISLKKFLLEMKWAM